MIRLPVDLSEVLRHGGAVVVPSRQRAHAARLAHAASALGCGTRVWATPDILPIDGWLIREVERQADASGADVPRILSPAEDWLLWRQCTAGATQDLELLNRGALSESLRRASALASEFDIKVPAQPAGAGAEVDLLCEVQRAVNDRCNLLGAATMQSLGAYVGDLSSSSSVTCAGFLMPSARILALRFRHRATQPADTRPKVVMAADQLDELELIAQWCKRQVASRPDARLLVILTAGSGARERLATLIRQSMDPRRWLEGSGHDTGTQNLVVVEGGASLADMAIVSHALSTLKWLGGATGELSEVSEWLRAPYWDAPDPGSRARIDLWLRERGELTVAGHEWVPMLSAAPASLLSAAQEMARQIKAGRLALGDGGASPREWSERFRSALDAIRWPGERARDSSEQQTVVRLHELLDEFGQLVASVRAMPRDEAIHLFVELASRTAFRPADDDAVVTVSGALADPIVLYDGIWVAGLHAEAFPQPVQPDPFLPVAAQIAAGVPSASAAGRLSEARALIAAWRASTDELVLSAPARTDDIELMPSPMLAQWLTAHGASSAPGLSSTRGAPFPTGTASPAGAPSATGTASPTYAPSWLPQLMHRPNMIECIEDSIGAPWPTDRMLPGTRTLELQNLCGFRAYAELRLGSAELGVPAPGVAPDVRGQLLHAALQHLWQELRDSRKLAQHSESSLDSLIERSVGEAANEVLGAAAGGARLPIFDRECRRARRLIKTLCALESARNPFSVQATEFQTTLSTGGARMAVRIDRLDRLDSGGVAILDYKSGARTPADWYGERPSHPQLLAYLAAIGPDVVAMATVNVTAREVRFDGIANSPLLLPKVKGVEAERGKSAGDSWQLHWREWVAGIDGLASDFVSGRATVDPKPGACAYCQVISICRLADQGLDVATEMLEAEAAEGGDE